MVDEPSRELPGAVLFACNHNRVRSPMAEGLMKLMFGDRVYVDSCGLRRDDEDEPDPFAVAVMDELGAVLARREPPPGRSKSAISTSPVNSRARSARSAACSRFCFSTGPKGQTIAMVVCSVAGIGLVAGLIAIPAGIVLHHYVLPVMGHAAQTAVPASVLNVYRPWELVLLALAGLVIAVAGALIPASWAARTRTAFALRAE